MAVPGFDPGSKYYQANEVDTSCPALQGGASGESLLSALWSGGGSTRGAVESAMKAANPDGLTAKAAAWDAANSDVDNYTSRLASAYELLRGAWQGDDADQALQTLGGLHATLSDQVGHTTSMSTSLRSMASELSSCKASWGHDSSTMGGFGNWVTGDDDRAAASDYNRMISNMNGSMEQMPHSVPTQVKPSAGFAFAGDYPTPGGAGPGGAPSVGGAAGAAHAGDAAAARIGQPGMSDPHLTRPREQDPRFPIEHPPDSGLGDPPYGGGLNGGQPGLGGPGGEGVPPIGLPGGATGVGAGVGSGFAGGDGAGVAPVGSTLLGFDPGASGAGAGALGAGGVIPGGGAGAAGSLSAGSGLEGGALMGGMSGGAGSRGEQTRTSAMPAGGSGAAAEGGQGMFPMRGGGVAAEEAEERERASWLAEDDEVWGGDAAASEDRGMLPMRGGLAGDDEDERERSTWLVEEDELWGGDQTASSVIVR